MGELGRNRIAQGTAPAMTRAALLGGTALAALVLATAAQAQGVPAALANRAASLPTTALPTGGSVVSGSAAIATSGTTLTVTQSSNNAAVNWRSFDVGTQGTVNFTAPSAQSVTINRVTGPDPSVIAGKVTANDQLVLVNQSGVIFTKGAEVNAQALVVSASGITDTNLKSGKLVFDQAPKAGAAVVNQGHITVGQTGLAALVAPEVVNSGVISAKLGHVVLAGAEATTVDLYGDGLMSIDVTRQVTTAPVGADGKPVAALVTNSGTIAANGGTVLLTAQAAEGLVTTLVTAGGKISANSTAGHAAGTVKIDATGGGATVTGTIAARGRTPGKLGGQIQVNASDAVTIAPTAKLSASGQAGGGTVAIGTTLARAKGGAAVTAPAAAATTIAPGARISADAKSAGAGGTVAVLSTQQTTMAGQISASGAGGGAGGAAEVSGRQGLSLTGTVNVGATGSILIDPDTLNITNSPTTPATFTPSGPGGSVTAPATGPADLAPSSFTGLTGNVTLQANTQINLQTGVTSATLTSLLLNSPSIDLAGNAIALSNPSGNTLSIQTNALGNSVPASPSRLSAATIELAPLTSSALGYGVASTSGTLGIPTTGVTLAPTTLLRLGAIGGTTTASTISIASALSLAGVTLDLQSGGGISQSAAVFMAGLTGSAGGTVALGSSNSFAGLGTFNAGANSFTLASTQALTQTGTLTAGTLNLNAASNGFGGTGLALNGVVNVGTGTATLISSGTSTPISQLNTGTIIAGTVTGRSTAATTLTGANQIGTFGSFTAGGTLALTNSTDLAVTNSVSSAGAMTISVTNAGNLTLDKAGTPGTLQANGGPISLSAANITLGTTGDAILAVGNTVSLQATGTVDEQGKGMITAGTLTGTAGGSVNLNGGANTIGVLGSLVLTAGTLSMADNSSLAVTGPVTAAQIGLTELSSDYQVSVLGKLAATNGLTVLIGTAGTSLNPTSAISIATGGTLSGSTVNLTTQTTNLTGNFVSQSGGMVSAGTLAVTAVSGGISLNQAANTLTTIGTIATGTGYATTLRGTGPMAFTGNVSTGALDLSSTGTISQTAGSIAATSLTSASGLGGLSLTDAGNLFTTYGGMTATGNVALRSDQTTSTNGLITAANVALTVGAGTLNLANPLSVPTGATVSLQADTITLGSGGVAAIAARTLGLLEIARFNSGASTTSGLLGGGILAAVNTGTLHLGGIGSATPTASTLAIDTALTLTGKAGVLQLSATGDISQTAGLTVGSLIGNSTTGQVALTSGGNQITAIGTAGLSAATAIALSDTSTLAITGPVTSTGAGIVTLRDDALNLSGAGAVSSIGGTVAILPLVSAGILIGPTSGAAIALGDLSKLSAATVRLGSDTTGATTATSILLSGNAATTAGTLRLDSLGVITQSAGTLGAPSLSGSAGGAINLAQSGNAIAGLGALSSTGSIAITTGSLAVTGGVTAAAGSTLTLVSPAITLAGGGSLLIPNTTGGGQISLSTDSLTGSGSITSAAGIVAVAPATAGNALTLGGAGLSLASVSAPTVRLGSLDGTTITAGSIAINSATGSFTTLGVFATGSVTQASGALVNAGTLIGKIGSATLTEANAIAAIGSLTSTTGGISLTNAGSVTLSGPVQATAAGQTVALSAGTLNVTGNAATTIYANAGTVQISADGFTLPTSAASGLITGSLVQIAPRTSGLVMTFGTSGSGLAVGATGISAGTLELGGFGGVAKAGSITLSGGINLNAGTLVLDSQGGITQPASSAVTVGALNVNAAGNVSLSGTGNAIGILGNVADPSGDFSLSDGSFFIVTGIVSAKAISLTNLGTLGFGLATAVPSYGTLNGSVSVNLAANGGNISESGAASIITPLLTGTLAGTGVLALLPTSASSNQIQSLGRIVALGGTLNLSNSTGLTVAGPVTTAQVSLSNTAGGIAVTGALTGTGQVGLFSSGTGNITETAAGSITTAQLTGSLTGTGTTISLLGTANAIGGLGNLTSPGSLVLVDALALPGSLAVTGTVSGSTVTLQDLTAGGTVALTGTLSGTGPVSVQADAMSLASGSITTPGLVSLAPSSAIGMSLGTTTAGALSLLPADLAKISAGTLALGQALGTTTAASISVAGASSLAVPLLLFSNGTIGLSGSLADTSPITLTAAGAVTGTAGSVLSTPTLSGSAGSVALGGTLNAIGTLGSFSAGAGGFALSDSLALTQTGTLTGGVVALSDSSTAVTLNGTILAGTSLAVTAPAAALTQAGSSVITTPLLSGSVLSAALLGNGNSITALGSFTGLGTGTTAATATGAVSVLDSIGLTQTGTLAGGTITLSDSVASGTGLTVNGTILANSQLSLSVPTAAIGQAAGGGIVTPLLTGSAASVALPGTGNAVTTLGGFSTGAGGFSLTDGRALTLSGTLTGGSVALVDTATGAAALSFTGTTSASTQLALTVSGGVTETAGAVITTPTLTGSAGSVGLVSTANTIGTLGSFATGAGAFALTDGAALAQTGTLTGGSVTLIDTNAGAAALALGGTTNASTLALTVSGGITEAAGAVVNVQTLTGSAGSVGLVSTTNTIGTLGSFTTGAGAFALTDGAALTQTGTLAGGSVTLIDTSTSAAALALGGTTNAVTLALTVSGGVTESAGAVVNAQTLTGSAGSVGLVSTTNTIGTLGSFATGAGAFALTDSAALTQTGTLAGGSLTLIDTNAGASALSLGGTTNASTLSLTVSGGVTETAGAVVNVQTLTGSAGSVGLVSTANTIATLGSFSTGAGAFALTDGSALAQTGTLTGGSVTLIDTNAGGSALALGGTTNAATLSVTVSGGVTEAAGAVVNVQTLTGSAGSVGLVSTANTIVTLGSFSTGAGAFALTDAAALTQTGTLAGGAVTLIDSNAGASALALGGTTNAATLSLTVSGGVTESAGAVVNVPSLTGSAGSVGLVSTANTIGTLGSFATGSGAFALTDAAALTQTGTLTGGSVTLIDTAATGSALAFNGTTNATVLSLTISGGVTEAAGAVVNTPSLSGSAGSVALGSTANTIGTLGSFATGAGSFTLSDAAALTQAGTLTGGAVALTVTNTGPSALAFTGTTNATTLSLTAAGGVTEAAGAVLNTPTLSGSAASVSLGSTVNTIGTLGSFATGSGAFALTDAAALTQTGTLTGGAVTLSDSTMGAQALNFTGTTNASQLALAVTGGVAETVGAVVNAQTLTGTAGSVALVSTANTIATLGSFSTGSGAFSLTDAAALTQSSTLSGGTVTLTDVNAGASALAFTGTTNATTLALSVTGGVTETAGAVVNTSTLSGTAGALGLGSTVNTIGTLGSFATGAGAFSLTDSAALTQTGTLTGGAVTLAVSNTGTSALSLLGTTNATSLSLNVAGGIVEPINVAGITAQTLSGSAASVSLAGPNTITTLGSFSTGTGAFSLNDGTTLTQTGTLTGGSVALSLYSGASSLGFTGTTNATTLSLTVPGAVTETAGAVINVQTLGGAGSAGASPSFGTAASVNLVAAGNTITTLGNFSTGSGAFTLTDSAALTQTGTLTGGAVTLTDTNTSAAALSFTGTTNATNLALTVTGGITETLPTLSVSGGITTVVAPGGVVNAQTLSGSAASLSLLAGNTIGTLGSFSTGTGAFSLLDSAALTQAGTLTGGTVSLTDTNTGAAALAFTGTTNATTQLSLSVLGGVAETAGAVLNTPGLTGTAGSANLVSTANTIGTLGSFSTGTGAFTLTDGAALIQSGTLTGGAVTLSTVGTGGLTVAGTINAGTGLSLNTAAGGVQEGAGTIITPTLTTATGIAGNAVLTGSANQIATLGSLAPISGALQLVDAQGLTLNGPVGIGDNGSIAVTGSLTLAGNLSAPGQTLGLSATGALSQTGGIVTAGTLSASGASISLGQGNLVGTYANLISQGAVSLSDAASLAVSGTISGSSLSITTTGGSSSVVLSSGGTISSTGSIAISVGGGSGFTTAGTIATPGNLAVTVGNASTGFLQTGGVISAGTLTTPGGVSGAITLNSAANRIGTLGGVTATGSLALTDGTALTVAGPVSAANIQLTDAGSITLAGAISTGSLPPSGSATSGTLDLATSAGGVSQSGGAINVATLSAANGVVGGLSVTANGNRIANLGSASVSGGNLVLTDAANLAVSGPVTAPNVSLVTAGSITLPGTLATPGTLSLAAGGTIVRPGGAGAFNVGTLTGSAMTLADFGTGDKVNTLGSFILTGSTLTLGNAIPLTVSGPLQASYIAITATDLLTLSGTVTTTGVPTATQLATPIPALPGTSFSVVPSGPGVTPTIQDLGLLTIQPSAGVPTATARFQLPANGGAITFDNLVAPQTAVLLYTNAGGTASGQIAVNQLYVVGTGGSTSLYGTIGTLTGPEAARAAGIVPNPQTTYRLNACPISSVNCVLIPFGALPPANPLHDFVLDPGAGRSTEDELTLPDVSSRDY